MAAAHIDLSYLERLYKGDRSRMEHWVRIYLEDAPALFNQLEDRMQRDDAHGLTATAHDLRPLAHYLGAQRMLDLLVRVGHEARASGAAACAPVVAEVVEQGTAIEAELRATFGLGPG